MRRMTNFWAFIKKLAGLVGFTGNKIEVGNDLEVDGKIGSLENIIDTNGHDRFVEGDIATQTISGLTTKYAKWSLSGSHLMIVIAGEFAEGATLSQNQLLCNISLPIWTQPKIKVIMSSLISSGAVQAFGDDWTQQTMSYTLQKSSENVNPYILLGGITFTKKRSFRIQIDLLIDTD